MVSSSIESVPFMNIKAELARIRPEIDAAIARVLDNASFCLGPEVESFEDKFAKALGVEHAIGVNSGTSALHLAAQALGLGPGDEVILPPFTFAATAWAVSYVGATPVFVDIEKHTFNIDPSLIEAKITSKTKAIVVVHLYGHTCDMGPILEIAQKYNLRVIEDAAQAYGATYYGRSVGSIGDIGTFSFYPAKNLGACGEGGMVTTNDAQLAQNIRLLRNHGSSERYLHEEIGYNYRMEGIQAAVLSVKLAYSSESRERRRILARHYDDQLNGLPLKLPVEEAYAESVYHLYTLECEQRESLSRHLRDKGVGTAVHYPRPLHLQPCYSFLGYSSGDFPVSESASKNCLSLPIYPELSDEQQNYVIDAVKSYFN